MTRVLVAGLGNMGLSHALAHHNHPGAEIVGLVNRSGKVDHPDLSGYPAFDNFETALAETEPDLAVNATYTDTHPDYACRAMKLSRRTLQRRLKAEKTSFQKILQEVRADLAVRYLSDRRLKALEVAMLLGYNNFSSFTTAFKSWYDMPPAEYRQKFLAF